MPLDQKGMSNGKVKKPFVFRLNDRGQGPDLIKQVFLERGWVEYDEDEQHESDWNLWWRTSRFRLTDYEHIFPWQRLNHYPKSTGITKKDCLVRNLKRMKGVHGAGVYNFSPLSFNLPNDYTRYVAEYGKLKSKTDQKMFAWICKPADMSRGRGIFLFRDISELQYDCNAVVQQYIANPLLIGGYKFDIRLYVAVPSFHPLTVYIFQEGIVRFSTEKFDLSALNNVFAHLTNTSINKHGPSYQVDKERIGQGCKWTLSQLRYYLHQNNIDDRLIWTKVINIIILTLLIQAPQVPKERNCYELYGFDILIDENLKPWLLEVNFSPALSTDCQVDVLVKKPMVHDLLDMLNFKDSDAERGGVDKRMGNAGRVTARGRMSANKSKQDPIDRTTSSSRLSNRGSIQRMNSTISTMIKSIEAPSIEPQLSFIHQDNPNIDKISEEKMCFGLPLVNHSDDEKNDDSQEHSGRSSVKSDLIETDPGPPISGRFTPSSNIGNTQPTLEQSYGSFERSGTMSSIVKKPESIHSLSQRGEKSSIKSLGNSDSAYSSFSDNSDKVSVSSTTNRNKMFNQRRKSYSLQSEVLSETPRENESVQIKSLMPTENSRSLRKVSHRGMTPVNAVSFRSRSRVSVPQVDRSLTRSRNFERAPSRNVVGRSVSRFGNPTSRSDLEMNQRNRSQTVMSSMSTASRGPKDMINLGLTGTSKKPVTNFKTRQQRSKSISMHHHRPKGPPPKVGEFFLVFPFSEGSYKAANATLDPHVVIKETQKLLKDLKMEIDKNPDNHKIGGHLPYGSLPDGFKLWAPVKPPKEGT